MSSSSYKLLFTVMVVITSVVLWSPMAAASVRADVYIYNQLVLGPTLRAQCRSKTINFEEQEIPAEEYWQFSFGLNKRGRTQFDCTFKWDDVVHSYPIYIQTRDACRNCSWAIMDDGPCLLQLKREDSRICFRWP